MDKELETNGTRKDEDEENGGGETRSETCVISKEWTAQCGCEAFRNRRRRQEDEPFMSGLFCAV